LTSLPTGSHVCLSVRVTDTSDPHGRRCVEAPHVCFSGDGVPAHGHVACVLSVSRDSCVLLPVRVDTWNREWARKRSMVGRRLGSSRMWSACDVNQKKGCVALSVIIDAYIYSSLMDRGTK
jgi:hypothetical protein